MCGREEGLHREVRDLEQRCQAAEARHQDLAANIPEATRPLLRQLEAMQVAHLSRLGSAPVTACTCVCTCALGRGSLPFSIQSLELLPPGAVSQAPVLPGHTVYSVTTNAVIGPLDYKLTSCLPHSCRQHTGSCSQACTHLTFGEQTMYRELLRTVYTRPYGE